MWSQTEPPLQQNQTEPPLQQSQTEPPLTVEFNPVTYNVNEEDQLVTLTIVLSNLAAEEVSVSIETNDGSALGK